MIEEVRLPEISENVSSGDVIQVLVKVGDNVEKEQPIAELETEKAAFDVPCPVKGKVVEINIKEGDKVQVNQVILKVDTGTSSSASPSVGGSAGEPAMNLKETKETDEKKIAPPSEVQQPVENIITEQAIKSAVIQSKRLPDFSKWGEIERQKITATRKQISEVLSYTWSNVPQVTQYDQADITSLEESRKLSSKKADQNSPKLTITSIAIKAVSLAMKDYPKFNSSFDAEKNEIIYKKYFHISVAVETDRGLLVPVIRDVDKKNIIQIASELNSLAEKTRQHKVTPDDMVGGNFTISNLGGIGGTNFAPIIYWPQAAILGISRAEQKPCYINGIIEPRLILPLSLSYDHRIIDGAEGLAFIRRIAQYLENPLLLALGEKI